MSYILLFSIQGAMLGFLGPFNYNLEECEAYAQMRLFSNRMVASYRCATAVPQARKAHGLKSRLRVVGFELGS